VDFTSCRPDRLTHHLRLAALGLCAAASMSLVPAAARADDVVATLRAPTPIAAYGGVLAWSDYDPATARYRLAIQRAGAAKLAPIAGAAQRFDVSLGPDVRGRVVALYTRCATPAAPPRRATDCDVYRCDVASGRERKLASVSSPRFHEAWPVQWRGNVAFARRATAYVRAYNLRPLRGGKRKNATRLDCDVPYVQAIATHRPSHRLDRGRCGVTTGMAVRRGTIVQTTSQDQGGAGSETQVRLLHAGGGTVRVLARAGGGEGGYSPFASPSLSAADVWLTRTGNRAPHNFLRIHLASRRMTEIVPHVPLAGGLARDERGSFWYVQAPEPDDQGEIGCRRQESPQAPLLQPCRLVRASASPFSATQRTLTARLTLSRPASGRLFGLFTDDLALAGRPTRDVVQRDAIVRREPVAGADLELLGRPSLYGDGPFTGRLATARTDASGNWVIALATPPPQAGLVVFARALGLATSPVDLIVSARVTLAAAGTALTGTVTPAQPGRSVAIQRLDPNFTPNQAAGVSPCTAPDAAGQRICPPQAWQTVAVVALSDAGTAFTATAGAPGIYQAVLPGSATKPDGSPVDPTAYGGFSPQVAAG
jgi:hypothetical protein